MRKIIGLAVFLMFSAAAFVVSAAQAEKKDEMVVVKKSDLPPELIKELEEKMAVENMAQKIKTLGPLVGVGKEIGTAVNESLSAITTQADNFAKTGVGKFTLYMVAYKILGRSLIGIIIGIPLLIVWTVMFVVFWRRLYCRRAVLDRVEGKTKFYKITEPTLKGEDLAWAGAFLFLGYTIAMIGTITGVIL